jgi:soluble lytic murein transglycosylase-like protein
MQVMPFWIKLIGHPAHNLFHLRTNLAYGCAILRHYLDMEKGDYFRALGRYNGSLGKAQYPNLVLSAWKGHWKYDGPTA